MTDIIKVCVRIPPGRQQDLLDLASQWRSEAAPRAPGWDAKAIRDIAKEHYGSFGVMFETLGWPERGTKMMPAVQARVRKTYGSVEAFVAAHVNRAPGV